MHGLRAQIGAVACTLALWSAGAAAVTRAPDTVQSTVDPAIMRIDEKRFLGNTIPRDFKLVDGEGREFTFGELAGKPSIVMLSYYGCDGTCTTLNQSLAEALLGVQRFRIGADYRVVTISFDGKDTPKDAAEFADKAHIPPALRGGWRHTVLKNRASDIEAFTSSVGFRYFWSQAAQSFLHPNVIVFLTPDGRVARYLYGTSLDARTIELALIDADWNRIANSSNFFDMLSGVCYSYNYAKGSYQPNYALLIGIASFVFGLAATGLGATVFRRRLWRRSHAS